MSLTPWLTFVEACRLGTLSATAELLGYTQSAVSRQVATLERDLGVALLVREARGVRPTAAGEALLPHARLVVAQAERGRHAATAARPTRPLVLGAVPSAAVSVVPGAVRRLPGPPAWSLVTGLTADLVDRAAAGEVDLAVVTDAPPGLPRAVGVTATHLSDDPMAVLLPASHPLADRRRLDLASLAGERWIEDNAGSETLLRQLGARQGVTLEVDRTPDDLAVKTALVAAGYGVALVPGLLGPALRPDVRLVALARAPRRGVYAVTRRARTDLADLVAAVRDEAVRLGRPRRAAAHRARGQRPAPGDR